MFLTFSWRRRRRAAAEERLRLSRRVLGQSRTNYSEVNGLPASKRVRARTLERLQFPLRFDGRIALLEGGFHAGRNLREFAAMDLGSLVRYAPEALVCPLGTALSLADLKLRGLFDLPSLSTALVVLTRLDDSPLADHHRDLLWQAFRVPVFEQVRGWDGTVIARECEVHDGLHVAESSVIPQLDNDELLITKADTSEECLVPIRTGFAAEIITGHCDCGTETPRLRTLMQAGRQTAALIGGDRAAMR
jgi:hypothetical protein